MTGPERSSAGGGGRRPARGAIERLYVYWLTSTLVLLLGMLAIAILTRAAVDRQTEAVADLAGRLAALERDLHGADAGPVEPPRGGAVATPARAEPATPVPEALRESAPRPTPPLPAGGQVPMPAVPAETALPTDAAIGARLDELVDDEPAVSADVTDVDAAAELVDEALEFLGRARWTAETWLRLAVLARLVGLDVAADAFAEESGAGARGLAEFRVVTARAHLARGRAADALATIEPAVERDAATATELVLWAAALLATGNPGAADELVANIPPATELHIHDRLLLARVLLALERWEQLDELLERVRNAPPELAAEQAFLVAAARARTGRMAEALALLDGIAAGGPAAPAAPARDAAASRLALWPAPAPSRYEIEVWRGIALMQAHQTEAARQVLQQAQELDPSRPEAAYYRGVLEERVGRSEIAVSHFKNALANNPRWAPALEALASLAIDAGQINLALQHLARAMEVNPRRASAYFLTALAHAKVSRPEPAGEALRAAFRLDPRYLDEAKQTEVLLRLFTSADLERLAAEAAAPEGERAPASDEAARG